MSSELDRVGRCLPPKGLESLAVGPSDDCLSAGAGSGALSVSSATALKVWSVSAVFGGVLAKVDDKQLISLPVSAPAPTTFPDPAAAQRQRRLRLNFRVRIAHNMAGVLRLVSCRHRHAPSPRATCIGLLGGSLSAVRVKHTLSAGTRNSCTVRNRAASGLAPRHRRPYTYDHQHTTQSSHKSSFGFISWFSWAAICTATLSLLDTILEERWTQGHDLDMGHAGIGNQLSFAVTVMKNCAVVYQDIDNNNAAKHTAAVRAECMHLLMLTQAVAARRCIVLPSPSAAQLGSR